MGRLREFGEDALRHGSGSSDAPHFNHRDHKAGCETGAIKEGTKDARLNDKKVGLVYVCVSRNRKDASNHKKQYSKSYTFYCSLQV